MTDIADTSKSEWTGTVFSTAVLTRRVPGQKLLRSSLRSKPNLHSRAGLTVWQRMTRNPMPANNISPGVAGGNASSLCPLQRGQRRGLMITAKITLTQTRISSQAVLNSPSDRSTP